MPAKMIYRGDGPPPKFPHDTPLLIDGNPAFIQRRDQRRDGSWEYTVIRTFTPISTLPKVTVSMVLAEDQLFKHLNTLNPDDNSAES